MNPFWDRDPQAPRYSLSVHREGILTGTTVMERDGRPMWAKWNTDGSGDIAFSEGATETWKNLAVEVRGPTVAPKRYVTRVGPEEER